MLMTLPLAGMLVGCCDMNDMGCYGGQNPQKAEKQETKSKKPEIMYAVQYTIDFQGNTNGGPRTIIEHVTVETKRIPVGLFYTESEDEGINRLVLRSRDGYYSQEICATRFRISAYGIPYWEYKNKPEK